MYRVGTDIVEVSRIRQMMQKYKTKFLKRIFSDEEIKYCMDKHNPEIHFAGKFAAKEAIKKTTSGLISTPYNKINILNDENGRPTVSSENLSSNFLDISISHTNKLAISFAILKSNDIRP